LSLSAAVVVAVLVVAVPVVQSCAGAAVEALERIQRAFSGRPIYPQAFRLWLVLGELAQPERVPTIQTAVLVVPGPLRTSEHNPSLERAGV
jgi:hypothetical protein